MSWIFGYYGKFSHQCKEQYDSIHDKPLIKIRFENFYICAGGPSTTCFYNKNEKEKRAWIVTGFGFITEHNKHMILDREGWHKILSVKNAKLDEVNGHFVAIRWLNEKIEILTDKLGLRDIYLKEINHGLIFSTRLDWIAKFQQTNIDFEEFGSRWLLFNQISSNSIISRVTRICANTCVIISHTQNKYEIKKEPWIPRTEKTSYNINQYIHDLKSIILMPLINGYKCSCSLSGGLDSRVILSFLLDNKDRDWDVHTFGPSTNPDVIVAKRISKELKLNHKHFFEPIPSADSCMKMLYDYIRYSQATNPASAILQLRYYQFLSKEKQIVIDGGFGEIWRREFFYRLLFKGKKAIYNKDIDTIINHLKILRADIFTDDINSKLIEGCKKQIINIYNEFPDINNIGVENWLDLFALKTRLINFYGPEQSRVDGFIPTYMPYGQIPLLENLFNIPVSSRRNSGLFRNILKINNIFLTRFPLAKSQTMHPFNLTSFQTRIWLLLVKKLRKSIDNNEYNTFFENLSEFILDTINSSEVKHCGFYNYKRLSQLASDLYKGEKITYHEIDWWLLFEIFRQISILNLDLPSSK